MSNYLETLVEKMVADGVSENDIKSVIEEVNSKKSPLRQDIGTATDTTGDEPENISLSGGDEGDVVVEESDGGDDETGNVETGTSDIGVSDSTKTTNKGEDVSIYSDDEYYDDDEEKISDKDKCEAEDGMCWDDDRGVCNRCIDIDEVVEDKAEVVKKEVKKDEKEEVNEEEKKEVYDASKSFDQNVIDIQEEINPNTQEFYSPDEAYEEMRTREAASKIEEQTYNPSPSIIPRADAYLKAKNVNSAQFVPENKKSNSSFSEVAGNMLKENGDFTLWKTNFTDENGDGKIAVFPNAMANNVLGEENVGVTDGFYYTDKKDAWDHMAKSSNYLLFDSQDDADSFIHLATGDDGYLGFVSPLDYDASNSVPSVNILRQPSGKQCPKGDIEEELKCIYFDTNRADKKKYPTFEAFRVAALGLEEKMKKPWNPSEKLHEALTYKQWLEKKGLLHPEEEKYQAIMRLEYERYVDEISDSGTYKLAIENTLDYLNRSNIHKITFSKTKTSWLAKNINHIKENSQGTYLPNGKLADLDKAIWLSDPIKYNQIHKYIFEYLPTVKGLHYDKEHMKHYFYEILDRDANGDKLKNKNRNIVGSNGYEVPFSDMPYTADKTLGGEAINAMLVAYEYVMDYKELQYKALVKDLKDWENTLLVNKVHRWVALDDTGNLIEVRASGETIFADLEAGKSLHAKIDILSTLKQDITTNNAKLEVVVSKLNAEITELRERLLDELEEWEIPGYEGEGVDTQLIIRSLVEGNKEANRINAVFIAERDKLVAKYQKQNKTILDRDEELKSEAQKEQGENARSVNNQIKLYLARIDMFGTTGLQSNLNLIATKFNVVLNEDLKNSLLHRQKKFIDEQNKLAAELDSKWNDQTGAAGIFMDFMKDTWVGQFAFKSFQLVPFQNPYSSGTFDYQVRSRTNASLYATPLDSKYGSFMMDEGEITHDGVTYIVYAKKGNIQGFAFKSSGDISTVKNNPKHTKTQQHIVEQLKARTIDLKTDYNWLGLSTTVGAEAYKMWYYILLTRGAGTFAGGIGAGARTTFWVQGAFQGLLYGKESYDQAVEHFLSQNKYKMQDDGALLESAQAYGLLMGVTTALIAQINVEGRIGGGKFSQKAVDNIMSKFISQGVASMGRAETIKFFGKEVGKMVLGETIEEWSEALLGMWFGKMWDNWQHDKHEPGDLKHNDVFQDMDGQDFLEMQIIVTATSGIMGGGSAKGRINSIKDANVSDMYNYLTQTLESDPTLKSLKENLELSKDGMSKEQYDNASKFINDALMAWNDNVDPKKFKYTPKERVELLKALVLKKDAENTIKELEKKEEKNEDDSKSLVSQQLNLEIYTELIEDIEGGKYFSEGHGGTTSDFNKKLTKYLTKKFPGLDHKGIQDKVNELIALENTPNFKETNPKDYKLLKEIRTRQKQLLKEMDGDLSIKAKEMAIEDNRDPNDNNVLNRYKQLFVVQEDWHRKNSEELNIHNQQVLENPKKFQELLTRVPDEVSSETTEAQWTEIQEACVTDRQRRLVASLYNKIKASPSLKANLYWSGGSNIKAQSGKNSYNYNTKKSFEAGGRVVGNVMDINMEHARSNVVDHETTHFWFDALETENPDAHKKMKDTLVEYIKRNPDLIVYVRFGEAYKKLKRNTARIKIDGVLETDAQFQARVDATITDEMIVEFLADVTSGKRPLGLITKDGALAGFLNMFKSKKEIGAGVVNMDFDQIINLVADICDGYSKGKLKHKGPVIANNIDVNGSKNTDHQSIKIDGSRAYIVYDNNNKAIDVGAEINRLYKTDPDGATDMSSRAFSEKILPLLNLVLENESKKSRGDKGAFRDTPGFDLHGFQIAAIYGSGNKAYENIFQTMVKFDPLVNDDFFGFIMTKGNKQGVFLPQMLDGLKSGDATNDFFYESLEHEQSMMEKGWDKEDLSEVQLPDDDVEIDINLIETEVDFDAGGDKGTGKRLEDQVDFTQEIMIDGKPVKFQTILDDVILKISGTKLPAYDEEVTANRLKTHPFTSSIFQQAGNISGTLRLAVKLLMGKNGDAYKDFLTNHKGLLIERLTPTYLSKNIPNAVEKFVVGIGWTTDWKGRKKGIKPGDIGFYTKADGPAWDGVTSGPPKIRTIKLAEDQTWDDIISDDAFVAIYMTKKDGKYSGIQSKTEGLEYQLAGEIGLQTFLDGLKDPKSDIHAKYADVALHIHNDILTDQSIINIENTIKLDQSNRGGDKEAINIRLITQNPDKYDGVFNNLQNIGVGITNLGNIKLDVEQVIKVVNNILEPIKNPKSEGKPLFTPAERKNIAKDIWNLVKKYNSASKVIDGDVTLPMFINKLLTDELHNAAFVKKYKIVDENNKPIVISRSFSDKGKVMTHRHLPLQMVSEMIDIDYFMGNKEKGYKHRIDPDTKKPYTKKKAEGKVLSKHDAVKYLLKHYKAQYTSAGKIGNAQIVWDKKTNTLVVLNVPSKGLQQRYQVFQNVDDFVANVVNKIPGVDVDSKGVGIIDKQPVNIDTKPATQTVKARRAAEYDENLEMALESREALMLQLTWLADKIKEKDSGYTKEDYQMLLMQMKSNMNTILRSSANLKYDIGSSYKGKVRYEHMIPAEIVCQILADKHLNPKTKITDEMLERFFENYNVAIISTEMDDMLKTFQLVSSMPIEWSPGNSALIRYYNDLSMGHSNLHSLTDLQDNTVVGEEFVAVSNALDVDQINNDAIELQIKSNPDLGLNSVVVINSKESINQKLYNAETIRFFDFDETLTIDGKNVVYVTDLNGKTKPMASSKFVTRAAELTEAGYTFDFKDFVNVRGGKEGPMLQKLRNQIERYGVKNIRILTARQPESALAIYEWLKTKGINLPLDNIKGLGVEGKTIRGIDKAIELETYIADGYTDIEMYDDSKDVVDAINDLQAKYDVKIEGIQVVEDYKESINVINSKFLEILKAKKGIDPDNLPTALQAEINAAKQWNFSLFPPSSFAFRDFLYKFLPKGKEGEDALFWLDEMLTKPYQKGVSDWKTAKVKLAKRYKDLIKSLPKINKKLRDKIPGLTTEFTYDDAVRVYIWNKNGYKIPEITPEELQTLLDVVNGDAELKALALGVDKIALKNYPKPTQDWIAQNVASDMSKLANESRAKYLTEWNENIDLMFTEEVRNTLLNTYGKKFMAAFDDMLYAMEYGTSKPSTEGELSRKFRVWVNNSIGTIMFLNMRSASLQTISMFNFIEMFGPNNIANAAKAVIGSPKIFIRTALELLNSDYVQSRLGSDSRGISEEEINKATDIYSKKSLSGLIAYLLKIGFTPTKIADMLAIVLGGGPFVMNYTAYYQGIVNPETDDLYTLKEAETQAMLDFQAKAEESQQSSDPSQISQLQRSNLGILLMGFKNTPMQYARIMLRAASDIKNRRGNDAQNLGKIAYYGLLQNAFFVFLQQAVWGAIGDEDEEEATDDALNSMVDNIISGLGLEGQILVTVKNGVLEYQSQKVKGWNADHTYTILQFLNLSPSIGSKFRKLYSAIKTEQINRDVMEEMGLEPGNPGVDAIANLISAFTNIPLDRVSRKVNNLILASNDEYEAIDRIALTLGWNAWDLGIETEANIIRNKLKEEKKSNKEKEKELKDKIKTEEIIKPTVEKEIEQYEKDKKDGFIEFDEEGYPTNKTYYCSAANKNKHRCGATVKKPGDRCEWHEDKDKDNVADYKQDLQKKSTTQCEFIKGDNERCKNKATGENGRCNVKQHQPGYIK
tara:strand:- start:69 stop:11171 length:11103 start_codon:yes stop_codon:yes gene_type:complete